MALAALSTMGSTLPVLLAMALAAEPLPTVQLPRPAVRVMAFVGAALVGVGLGFEISGRVGSEPSALPQWRAHAQANTVGGLALLGTGLCLITIAAVLTQWRLPSVALSVTPGGAMVAFGAPWP